jgi:hypothetical protein
MQKRNIHYLEKDLKHLIQNDIKRIALYYSRVDKRISAGFFSTPRHVFCIVDFLGYLYLGEDSSTKRAEKFMKKYFPKNYDDYVELLIATWRQGTVHQNQPYSYYVEHPTKPSEKIVVKWLANNSNQKVNRNENLKTYSMRGKKGTTIYLVLNNCQLVDDLIEALENFVLDLKKDKTMRFQCENRINKVMGSVSVFEIKGSHRQNVVSMQIIRAWKNRSGLINKEGAVVKRYK